MMEIYWYPLIVSVILSLIWYQIGNFRFLSTHDRKYVELLIPLCIEWCSNNLGQGIKSLHIRLISENSKVNPDFLGQYDFKFRTIEIFPQACTSNLLLIETIIHEYVHHLQDLKLYQQCQNEMGYLRNPLEIEARKVSKVFRWKCLNYCHEKIKLN